MSLANRTLKTVCKLLTKKRINKYPIHAIMFKKGKIMAILKKSDSTIFLKTMTTILSNFFEPIHNYIFVVTLCTI